MSSCSYLGLHRHPDVLAAARNAIGEQAYLSIAPVRIRLRLLEEVEEQLRKAFRADVIYTTAATYSTLAVLPLLASGHIGDGKPRALVFDKNCHFSMALAKPICADETEVLTIAHNSVSQLEDACKKFGRVAYVADGVYSMGGRAVLDELFALQNRYDLFLYFDDAHSISIFGETGEGYVRDYLAELNERTIIVGSLAKAFGSAGGFISCVNDGRYRSVLERFGGPVGWSQEHLPSVMAATLASARLHQTPVLAGLQKDLREKIAIFDRQVVTEDAGSAFPVRVVTIGNTEDTIRLSKKILSAGFYVSPVFFPIVARDQSGIRVMLRTDVPNEEIYRLSLVIREELSRLDRSANT
jgi:7-keto-8-aminopelargonate synthetase-like enzyme